MIVAALQLDIAWERPADSFDRASALAEGAAGLGARLLALPELFATGFTMDSAAAADAGQRSVEFMAGLARRHGVWVLGGLAEAGPVRPFNACAVFDPDGREAGRYRKLHPFSPSGEEKHYAAGEAVATFDVEGVAVTPFICYDLRFPEPFRAAADRTDLFVIVANWPSARSTAWQCLLTARAIENQAYVLGANRVGAGDNVTYSGDSALHDPAGVALARASGSPAVVAGPVDRESVAEARRRFGFLSDRRPNLYRRL